MLTDVTATDVEVEENQTHPNLADLTTCLMHQTVSVRMSKQPCFWNLCRDNFLMLHDIFESHGQQPMPCAVLPSATVRRCETAYAL
mmetsp:Transcript_6391/g.11252  ORF Transcript_6391/g.11252 Transcript_6391/m.11252 type:complete len:86 (-) Transcript_6391:16-273(-)